MFETHWLPGVMVKWYAWTASYPATALEGQHPQTPSDRNRLSRGLAICL